MLLTLVTIYFLRLMLTENEDSEQDVTAGIITVSVLVIAIDILFTIMALLLLYKELTPFYRLNSIVQSSCTLLSIFMPIISSMIFSVQNFKILN